MVPFTLLLLAINAVSTGIYFLRLIATLRGRIYVVHYNSRLYIITVLKCRRCGEGAREERTERGTFALHGPIRHFQHVESQRIYRWYGINTPQTLGKEVAYSGQVI